MRPYLLPIIAFFPCAAIAQETPDLLNFEISAGAVNQSQANIDGGGSVSANAAVIEVSAFLPISHRAGIGIGVELGRGRYEFNDVPAFGKNFDYRSDSISLSYDFLLGNSGFGFIALTLRWNGEVGGDMDKAMTRGVSAGAAWQVSASLLIGPALGIFSELDGGAQVFPFLLIEWDINERLQLATGEGLGATQGPGLVLTYALTEAWTIGLAGRIESVEFRLEDDSAVPNGIARDQSFPLVASIGWDPNDSISLAAFAGVQTNGKFTLSDKNGRKQDARKYDNAPILGAILKVGF